MILNEDLSCTSTHQGRNYSFTVAAALPCEDGWLGSYFAQGAPGLVGGLVGWFTGEGATVLLVGGIALAPTVVPILPVETLANITGAGGGTGVKQERREEGQLPQHFADRFGWENMAATVAGVYDSLPAEDRSRACVFTANYGEAGAIDFFGKEYGLPEAISGHNSYHVWGPGDCTGEVVISAGVPHADLEVIFGQVEKKVTFRCEYCMPDEDDLPVYVCREPRASLQALWPQVKHYD